jgi:hypothetical protein
LILLPFYPCERSEQGFPPAGEALAAQRDAKNFEDEDYNELKNGTN